LQSLTNNITKYNQKYLTNNNNIYNLQHKNLQPNKKINKIIKIYINKNNYNIRYSILSTNARLINNILENCLSLSVRIIKDMILWRV